MIDRRRVACPVGVSHELTARGVAPTTYYCHECMAHYSEAQMCAAAEALLPAVHVPGDGLPW